MSIDSSERLSDATLGYALNFAYESNEAYKNKQRYAFRLQGLRQIKVAENILNDYGSTNRSVWYAIVLNEFREAVAETAFENISRKAGRFLGPHIIANYYDSRLSGEAYLPEA
jgi:hypothetical protein